MVGRRSERRVLESCGLRTVFANGVYLVNAKVLSVTPRDRPGKPSWDVKLEATVSDAEGNTAVEATSHYVLKTF